jgi:hypothetical protein
MFTGLYFDANTIANAMPGSEFCELAKRCAVLTWNFMQSEAATESEPVRRRTSIFMSTQTFLCEWFSPVF